MRISDKLVTWCSSSQTFIGASNCCTTGLLCNKIQTCLKIIKHTQTVKSHHTDQIVCATACCANRFIVYGPFINFVPVNVDWFFITLFTSSPPRGSPSTPFPRSSGWGFLPLILVSFCNSSCFYNVQHNGKIRNLLIFFYRRIFGVITAPICLGSPVL